VTVVDLRAETRAYGRARLRELALDAAREVVLDRGWAAVRMGAIATQIGISRQSLHAEFGTKDDLGNALVLRELTAFFDGVTARLSEHPGDLAGAVSAAVEYMVSEARDDPLLGSVLTRSGAQSDDGSLLPLLTVRGEPLIDSAIAVFGDWVAEQWPSANPQDVRVMVESVVRLCQSHILTPTKTPDAVAADLALVACRCLVVNDSPPAHREGD
jgi:AcrR family transcriptional regulator